MRQCVTQCVRGRVGMCCEAMCQTVCKREGCVVRQCVTQCVRGRDVL